MLMFLVTGAELLFLLFVFWATLTPLCPSFWVQARAGTQSNAGLQYISMKIRVCRSMETFKALRGLQAVSKGSNNMNNPCAGADSAVNLVKPRLRPSVMFITLLFKWIRSEIFAQTKECSLRDRLWEWQRKTQGTNTSHCVFAYFPFGSFQHCTYQLDLCSWCSKHNFTF